MKKKEDLRETAECLYDSGVNLYAKLFCEKHALAEESLYWIGEKIGEVFEVNGEYYDFRDIKADIDLDAPAQTWWDYQEYYKTCRSIFEDMQVCNYENYIKGCPVYYSKDEIKNYWEIVRSQDEDKIFDTRKRLFQNYVDVYYGIGGRIYTNYW